MKIDVFTANSTDPDEPLSVVWFYLLTIFSHYECNMVPVFLCFFILVPYVGLLSVFVVLVVSRLSALLDKRFNLENTYITYLCYPLIYRFVINKV